MYEKNFEYTIKQVHGIKGIEWLDALPILIKQCVNAWELQDLQVVENLTYNYVMFGTNGDKQIVLKLGCDTQAVQREYTTLVAYKDYGAVSMFDYSKELGALLLEHLNPGGSLETLFAQHDKKATQYAARLLEKLHKAPFNVGMNIPLLQQEVPFFDKDYSQLEPFKQKAIELRHRLLVSENNEVLLHGDFHQGNIVLSGIDDWKAIDPAGMLGNPLYDVAVYIRNPLKKLVQLSDAQMIIKQRIEDFSLYLGYEKQAIYEWAFLQAFISAYWSLQDGLDAQHHCEFLSLLEPIKL
ncbi:MAG: aminoglycoside phosphotransferase family protein [Candidatus Babeliales bacterium]|jgi:streptomycin 6-kinase